VEPLDADDPAEIAGYRLRARLGSGGMGRVYLAATSAGRPVALKVVRPELGDDAEFRRRFRQEVEASRRVHGMYTAQVLDAGLDARPPWLVTAYVPGPSLHQAVSDHGPMPEATVFALVAGVAEALGAIHQAGIVHRDLKPSNVLLAQDGPRVIDFGIARAADATVLTGKGTLIGSPPYMAPEQVTGAAVTPATDVFALGSLAAFTATGRTPFGEGADMAVMYRVAQTEPDLSGCPPRLRALAARCLAKDPAARPSTAQVIAECRAQAAGQPGEASMPWLPPDVLAELTSPLASPASAPSTPRAWSPPGTTPLTAAEPVTLRTFYAGQPPATPFPSAANPAPWPGGGPPGAVPPPEGPAGPGPVPGRRARRQVLIGAGAVAGVAAVAAVAVLVFSSHGGNPPAPGPSGSHPVAAGTGSPASPSAGTSYAVDSCVVGQWTDAGDVLTNTIDEQQAKFTGKGGSLAIKPDGSVAQQFGPETLSSTVDNYVWTEVLAGSGTMSAATGNGKITFSNIELAPDATFHLYKDGSEQNHGPISVSTNPNAYTCTPSTLTMTWDNGTSTYTRAS
jgi:serine/threonine protein kinase